MRKIYIIAGEASGDVLAAHLMRSLARKFRDKVEFYGIGGDKMKALGLKSLFPMESLSLVGLVEIVPQYLQLRRLLKRTVMDIKRVNPDMLITVDVPDFSLAVAKAVARESFIKTHLVAPSVWAWRRGRAKKFARFYDKILCLFPFEPDYFKNLPTDARFIGHALWETPPVGAEEISRFRRLRYIGDKATLLLLLPGSRAREVRALMPVFIETARRLRHSMPQLRLAILTLPHLRERILSFAEHGLYGGIFDDVLLVDYAEHKEDLIAAADFACAASGTVTLELAKAQTPFVVGYKVHPLTAFLLRLLLRVKYVALPNILADKPIVEEFLQSRCNPGNLAKSLEQLLRHEAHGTRQIEQAFAAVEQLKPISQKRNGKTPSAFAADVLYEALQNRKVTS